MRTLVMIALLSACGLTEPCDGPQTKCVSADTIAPSDETPPPGVKVHGNLPIRTVSELAAKDTIRDTCLAACDEADAACKDACMAATPIEQVEVVPDMPIAPPQ